MKIKIQKIIAVVRPVLSFFFRPKDRLVLTIFEHKDGNKHTIVKTLKCEGKDNIKSLGGNFLTYLK